MFCRIVLVVGDLNRCEESLRPVELLRLEAVTNRRLVGSGRI